MGITLRELLDTHAGGVRGGWDNLLAIIPGGSSMPLIRAEQCQDLTLDFDALAKLKSGLGTGCVIVMDKTTDPIKAITRIAYFYKHESCGQCTPCRVGTEKAVKLMQSDIWDADLLAELSQAMRDASICGLGQAAPNPMDCVLKYFPEEVR